MGRESLQYWLVWHIRAEIEVSHARLDTKTTATAACGLLLTSTSQAADVSVSEEPSGLGWYVGRSATVSPFGAAGSLVALIVWVYYSAQILFFGAEFTQVFATRYGSRILPSSNAVHMDDMPRQRRARDGRKERLEADEKAAAEETG